MSETSKDDNVTVTLKLSGRLIKPDPPPMPVAFRRTTGTAAPAAGDGSAGGGSVRATAAEIGGSVDGNAGNGAGHGNGSPPGPPLPAAPALDAASASAQAKINDQEAIKKEELFLPNQFLRPKKAYDVTPTSRDAANTAEGETVGPGELRAGANDIFVFELSDGGIFVANPWRLLEAFNLAGAGGPDAEKEKNVILLDKLGPDTTARRGVAAALNGMITKVTLLEVMSDQNAIAAGDKILARMSGEQLTRLHESDWNATQALMGAIEHPLDHPGLYRWKNSVNGASEPVRVLPDDPVIAKMAPGTRILVFVHGIGSSTLGSFGHLCTSEPDLWKALVEHFREDNIYGYEHHTLSESPIDNALALAEALPKGAQVSFVSHSRGGLVTDLLCLADFHAHIPNYKYQFERVGTANETLGPILKKVLDGSDDGIEQDTDSGTGAYAGQRRKLQMLAKRLQRREFKVQRYVRIASPANGTLLASGNFDVFLSSLLTLLQAVPFLYSKPLYWAFSRAVIEVARRGIDPHIIPGIEAMLPDSPLAQLLSKAPVQDGVEMAVIAGDSQDGNMLNRLRVALTDFVLFDKEDNDMIVDTPAMLAGIAPTAKARVMFDHGSHVSHFRYATNSSTRSALRDWLLAGNTANVARFTALPGPEERVPAPPTAGERRGLNNERLPVVVVLPDLMGSHLDLKNGNGRIWFPLKDSTDALDQLKLAPEAVEAREIFDIFYGKLCRHLAASHNVFPFAYDWRQPLEYLGQELARFLERFRTTEQPVRLLAHGMGGLVVRACTHVTTDHGDHASPPGNAVPGAPESIIKRLMAREGSRFIMLGTPNHGTYSVVADLLGKGDAFRSLWRLDAKGPKFRDLTAAFAGFAGFLSLLPTPDFADVSQAAIDPAAKDGEPSAKRSRDDYHKPDTWQKLALLVSDRWFDSPGTQPDAKALEAAKWLFEQDAEAARQGGAPLPVASEPKTVYVFGVSPSTPCGLERLAVRKTGDDTERSRIAMLATPAGDGVVTWESGRLTGIDSYYFMPARHGDLPASQEYFPALLELLKTGATHLLAREAPVRPGERSGPLRYDAAPPTAADSEAVQRCLLGGSVRRRLLPGRRRRLAVAVRAMDLRFVSKPIMVGHYEQDPIAGPEALIDRELLGADLSKRYNLGQYAGPRGSASVVLRGATACEQRGRLSGAVVTGLGHYDGSLSASQLTESVRVGALRFLLQVVDVLGKEDRELELGTLLLGFNSSANLTAASSVEALVRGVLLANARFHETTGLNICIASLDIVEMYLDTAVSAAYALHELDDRLRYFAGEHDTELETANELVSGEGARQRFRDTDDASYWPRIIVTNADGLDASPVQSTVAGKAAAARIADRLRFMFVGTRARAETTVQQRQPNLIEMLVRQQVASHRWDAQFGRMLFQLMVPHDFKDAMRQHDRLVLVVDDYTANLPWELMLAEGPANAGEGRENRQKPLAVRTSVVRQLATTRYRPQVVQAAANTALVIGNPSVRGFRKAFTAAAAPPHEPAPLRGAYDEARSIVQVLQKHDYGVTFLIGKPAPATTAAGNAAAATVTGSTGGTTTAANPASVQGRADWGVGTAPERASERRRDRRTGHDIYRDAERDGATGYDGGPDPDRDAGDIGRNSDREADNTSASKVLAALYRQPWRILHISGHGVFQLDFGDERLRSGVLLSDGLLITAAEIAAMEVVPELVFLNCCHSGQFDNRHSNRLAASIASELIDIGVRCVLVAGWAVDDNLAKEFGIAFYNALLGERKQFGEAVFLARNKLWDDQQRNAAQQPDLTWGAFQAYGDPGWMAETVPDDGNGHIPQKPFVSLEELIDALTDVRVRLAHQRNAFAEQDGTVMLHRVNKLVHERGQPKWIARPELHSAIGATMRELNEVKRAYQEFLCTVQLDDPFGRVPIRDIEQLADVEAEYGEQCSEQALAPSNGNPIDTQLLANGEQLIRRALNRLDGLDRLTSLAPDLQDDATDDNYTTTPARAAKEQQPAESMLDPSCPLGTAPNCLRKAMRGRICQRMASVQARRILSAPGQAASADAVAILKEYLGLAISAYREAEGGPSLGYFFPNLTLHRLALEALKGEFAVEGEDHERKRAPAVTLARLCGQDTDVRLTGSAAGALLRARSMLVEELIGGEFGADDSAASRSIFDSIAQAYLDATTNITLKPSELDAIVTELESLSRLFQALAKPDDQPPVRQQIAKRLRDLARELRPRRTFLAETRSLTGLSSFGKSY